MIHTVTITKECLVHGKTAPVGKEVTVDDRDYQNLLGAGCIALPNPRAEKQAEAELSVDPPKKTAARKKAKKD